MLEEIYLKCSLSYIIVFVLMRWCTCCIHQILLLWMPILCSVFERTNDKMIQSYSDPWNYLHNQRIKWSYYGACILLSIGTATISAHDLNQTNLSGRNLSETNLLADRVYEHSRQSGGSTHSLWAHLLHDTVIKAINDGVITKTYVESAWRYFIAA